MSAEGCPTVTGIVPADENYKTKLAAYRACVAAKVSIPKELQAFFRNEEPGEDGMEVSLTDRLHPAIVDCSKGMMNGYLIDLSRLPPEVKLLRVSNHY